MYMYANGKYLVAFMQLKIEFGDEPSIGDYITLYWREEHDPDDIFCHDEYYHNVIFEIVSYDMNDGFAISPISPLSRADFEKMQTRHTKVVYNNNDMVEKIVFEDIKPFEDEEF